MSQRGLSAIWWRVLLVSLGGLTCVQMAFEITAQRVAPCFSPKGGGTILIFATGGMESRTQREGYPVRNMEVVEVSPRYDVAVVDAFATDGIHPNTKVEVTLVLTKAGRTPATHGHWIIMSVAEETRRQVLNDIEAELEEASGQNLRRDRNQDNARHAG